MGDKSKNIIDLYVAANENKYKIVQHREPRDYSYAEFTVLACLDALFRAEYYESKGYDVNKVIRVLLMDSLKGKTDCLSNQTKVKALASEMGTHTENARQAAISTMNTFIDFKDGCEDLNSILRKYQKLQTQIRTGHKYWGAKGDRLESDLEHIYGTMILALGIEFEYGDQYDLDFNKLLIMLLIHETDEIIKGDETVFDGKTREESLALSQNAEQMVLGGVKNGQHYIDMLSEFDKRQTLLSQYGHLCDKLEYDMQVKMYELQGRYDFENRPASPATTSKAVQEIIANGASSVFEVHYEYDKQMYYPIPLMRKLLELTKNLKN